MSWPTAVRHIQTNSGPYTSRFLFFFHLTKQGQMELRHGWPRCFFVNDGVA
jgi:hypothetical protein